MNRVQTSAHTQGGATLAVVVAILLVATVLIIGGLSLLNQYQRSSALEMDRVRAMEAAQALLQDAEQDIKNPNARSASGVYFPLRLGEYDTIRLRIAAQSGLGCASGICTPEALSTWSANHWQGLSVQDAFWETGAGYGSFTGAQDASATSLLSRGRYWVEVLVYNAATTDGTAGVVPDAITPFVYRVTAVAFGQRDGTQVVLQTLVVPVPES